MSHFAEVIDGKVKRVIVAEQDFINSGSVGDPSKWIQTSYNTHGGIHNAGGTPLRKNFANIGYSYDSTLDAFIPPKPFNSWLLDSESCTWVPPVPCPEGVFDWNESSLSWEPINGVS